MTYELPTTNKDSPIVKEDDGLDSPPQVITSYEVLFFRQMASKIARTYKLTETIFETFY